MLLYIGDFKRYFVDWYLLIDNNDVNVTINRGFYGNIMDWYLLIDIIDVNVTIYRGF